MGRALLGLLKGLIVGGAVGYGLIALGQKEGVLSYLGCALVGALVGLICGKAPWRAETIWTPALKMIFGTGVGVGLYALGHHFLPAVPLPKFSINGMVADLTLRGGPVLAPAIGMLYGLLVEIDDGGDKDRDRERERQKLAA